jgi:hypothetical protein
MKMGSLVQLVQLVTFRPSVQGSVLPSLNPTQRDSTSNYGFFQTSNRKREYHACLCIGMATSGSP